eukprot:5157709-Pyramimonas_sp.AAC.1
MWSLFKSSASASPSQKVSHCDVARVLCALETAQARAEAEGHRGHPRGREDLGQARGGVPDEAGQGLQFIYSALVYGTPVCSLLCCALPLRVPYYPVRVNYVMFRVLIFPSLAFYPLLNSHQGMSPLATGRHMQFLALEPLSLL